jgi:hypothetical protein
LEVHWISCIDLAKLVDPVLRPKYIPNAGDFRTVIIDPGHGGKDPGAANSLGTEAAYGLDIARRLRRILIEHGYKVVMTRTDDIYLSLQERVDRANAVKENPRATTPPIHGNGPHLTPGEPQKSDPTASSAIVPARRLDCIGSKVFKRARKFST